MNENERVSVHSTSSSLNGAKIHAVRWQDNNNAPKAVVVVVHGMAEHSKRYESFAKALCENGYAVILYDQIGHGKSVANDAELGFFGEKDGWQNLVEDVYNITSLAKELYPGLPVLLFGHSMGSFISRLYCAKYAQHISGAVICGTSGNNPAASAGIALANMVCRLKGARHRSPFIDKIAFGTYNKKIKPPRTSFDWLTRDESHVDKYISDDYCGFLFTAAGYRDLFKMLTMVSNKDWFSSLPKEFPMYFIAGTMDPVGNYGEGVKDVVHRLQDSGMKNIELKLYPNARHELLNESCADETIKDVIEWFNKVVK